VYRGRRERELNTEGPRKKRVEQERGGETKCCKFNKGGVITFTGEKHQKEKPNGEEG